MPQSPATRKAAERARKRAGGLRKIEIWRRQPSRNVTWTLRYMRQEIAHGADITLTPEDARELLAYFGVEEKPSPAHRA
jgi:hypothetical protein